MHCENLQRNCSSLGSCVLLSVAQVEKRSFHFRFYNGYLTDTCVSADGIVTNHCGKHVYTSWFSFCGDAEMNPLYWRFRQVYFCRNANCRHVSAARKFGRYSIIRWLSGTVSAETELDQFTLCSLHVFCRFLFRWIIYSLHFLNVETLLKSPVWNHILFILSGI